MALLGKFLDFCLLCSLAVLIIAHPITEEAPEYQEFFTNEVKTDSSRQNIFDNGRSEFREIKRQIVNQFFAEHDRVKLAIILDTIGCIDLNDCPALADICNIDFNIITEGHQTKRFIASNGTFYKTLMRNFSETLVNDESSENEFSPKMQEWLVMQRFSVNVSKTGDISAAGPKGIPFTASNNVYINFMKHSIEHGNISQPDVIYSKRLPVHLKPYTKTKVTFRFYEVKLYNYYFLDFELDPSSSIRHPIVDENSKVVFGKTPLLDFIANHVEFVKNMQFQQAGIQLVPLKSGAVLKNFPTTELIISHDISIEVGENMPTTTTTTIPTTIPSTTTTAPSTTTAVPSTTTTTK